MGSGRGSVRGPRGFPLYDALVRDIQRAERSVYDAVAKTLVQYPGSQLHSDIAKSIAVLQILKNIDHRGAVGADQLMGDGAGILIQIPDQFYRDEMAKQGVDGLYSTDPNMDPTFVANHREDDGAHYLG